MSSGSRVVSQSMNAKATKAAENPHQTSPVGVIPQRWMHRKKRAPVAISIKG
jgi:hypothetical protein